MTVTRLACAGLVTALVGCDAAGHSIAWTLRFEDPSLAAQSVWIEALVLEGGCDGAVLYRADVPSAGPGPEPPILSPGRYGLAASATSAACATIARGCVEVDLPLPEGARVVVPMASTSDLAACAVAQCRAGRCEGTDAVDAAFMPADGGVERPDAGPPARDAGPTPIDAQVDAAAPPIDAGPGDAALPEVDGGADCDVFRGARCYRIGAATASWSDAEAMCATWGGHLVAFADADEEREVMAGHPEARWMGLTDAIAEGVFRWVDGSPTTYTRWAAGSPTSSPPWRDCAVRAEGGWTDERCTDVRPYVCER